MQLSYLDAYYYKLLLEVGFAEDVNKWILSFAENCDVLEGIFLDLVSNQGDDRSVISCLHNYIGESKVDDDVLAIKLRLFILEKYENNSIDLFTVAESCSGFACLFENWKINNFGDFHLIGEAYSLMLNGGIKKSDFEEKVISFLKNGEHLNYDYFFHHPSAKEIFKKEKQDLNKVRTFVNYKLVPFIFLITIICFSIIIILNSIDEKKYLILSISLIVLVAIIYILLMAFLPYINKKSYQLELSRYDFTIDERKKEEYVVYTNEKMAIIFKEDGLYVMNKYYKYDDLTFKLYSSNVSLKVNIFVYIFVEKINYLIIYWHLALEKELINAIEKYNIKLVNHDKYNYIINNKEEAFKAILKHGYIESL